jgi:hypothetical protein
MIDTIAQLMVIALTVLLLLFSLVVFRQVQMMTKVLLVPVDKGFRMLGLGLVIYSVR